MVKFKTKINQNKTNNQHTISIPSFVFKQNWLEFDENAEYSVEIEKIEQEKKDENKNGIFNN